jgi:predicted TIM-barrel enzyme
MRSAAILLTLMCASFAAMAQTPSPDAPSAAPAPSVGAFGDWVQQGVANMGAGFGAMVGAVGGQANQTARGAADAARNAATGVSKLPSTGITTGNERCVAAPNGAPDCRLAAETLCRAKGYAGGASIDFVTVENCPPRYRTTRREIPEGVCTRDHFVTRALCQ